MHMHRYMAHRHGIQEDASVTIERIRQAHHEERVAGLEAAHLAHVGRVRARYETNRDRITAANELAQRSAIEARFCCSTGP